MTDYLQSMRAFLTERDVADSDASDRIDRRARSAATETVPSLVSLRSQATDGPEGGGTGLGAPLWLVHVRDEQGLTNAAALLAHELVLGCDLETTGLDPHSGELRLLTLAALDVAAGATVAFVVDCYALPRWAETLGPLLADPTRLTLWHNAVFDLTWLLARGVAVGALWDTLLAAQVVNGGVPRERGYFSLAAVTERELGVSLDKTEQTGDWGAKALTGNQLEYAAHDAAVLLELHARQQALLVAEGLWEAAQLEFGAVPAVAWLELTGAPFDAERWVALSDGAMAAKLAAEDETRALLDDAGLNLDSPLQVKRALAARGVALGSVDEESLLAVAADEPVVRALIAYRSAGKLAGTYGLGFLAHLHPYTGRIHASYRQVGAATGRMACSAPNLQNIPRDPRYRACFRPATGRLLVKADLSLVELCVAAAISRDGRLIAAIVAGQDLHCLTAAALFGTPPEAVTREQRAFGKAVNFGTLYGQGLRGLVETARGHGLTLSDAEARRFQRRFAQAWPGLAGWRSRQLRDRSRVVRTVSGRVRWLDHGAPGTVRANTPIQGTAADGFKAALHLLWTTRERFPTAVAVLVVHDELVVECDTADGDGVAAWVSGCLSDGMASMIDVPVRVDVTIARDWSGQRA